MSAAQKKSGTTPKRKAPSPSKPRRPSKRELERQIATLQQELAKAKKPKSPAPEFEVSGLPGYEELRRRALPAPPPAPPRRRDRHGRFVAAPVWERSPEVLKALSPKAIEKLSPHAKRMVRGRILHPTASSAQLRGKPLPGELGLAEVREKRREIASQIREGLRHPEPGTPARVQAQRRVVELASEIGIDLSGRKSVAKAQEFADFCTTLGIEAEQNAFFTFFFS